MPYHACTTCRRPATLIVTGRRPGKTLYSALTCDTCLHKHRALAAKAGPVQEEPLKGRDQDPLF
ncbi:MAG TPA: hypothetical protein VMZ00_09125 [Sporichthya sp.]|nr:hypothetical protein [Sporichthya sp.]